jgi:glycosyltransferase involved in cell wall biosynthesis
MTNTANRHLLTKKKVLFIAPQPFLTDRGSPFRVRSTVTSLAELGFNVDLLVFPIGSDVELPGVSIKRSANLFGVKHIPIGPSWQKVILDSALFASAINLVKKNDYDAIHAVEEAGAVACLISKLKGIPFVFDMHSSMSEQLSLDKSLLRRAIAPLFAALERQCIRRASGVITVSDKLTQYSRKISAEVTAQTLNDLPLAEAASPSADAVLSLKNELGSSDKRLILYTGNFKEYQGIELLLDAYAVLCKNAPHLNTVLVLTGGGKEEQHTVTKLKAQAQSLGIIDNLIFSGQRPGEQMGVFMQAADILISPRLCGDNTPLKIYSYMKAKKPIVATRISSHTQVLDDSCAFLAEPNDIDLAQALITALTEDEELNQLRNSRISEAYRKVTEDYGTGQFLLKLNKIYQFCGSQITDFEPKLEGVVNS